MKAVEVSSATFALLPRVFRSCSEIPISPKRSDTFRWVFRSRRIKKRRTDIDAVTLLFTNSWHQGATGFYLRGGLDVLEAYSMLYSEYKNLRLIVRSKLPDDLNGRYRQIIERCNVTVIDRFLPADEVQLLFESSDVYLLPSARLHVVSIVQAMAHGLTIVTSDGWGIAEYIDHERNGLIVAGRYGETSWMTPDGMLMEDYRPLLTGSPKVANALTEVLAMLINEPGRRRHLGATARQDVETIFRLMPACGSGRGQLTAL
jgi:glycosyltransferase involved in cell wall biosynthesis